MASNFQFLGQDGKYHPHGSFLGVNGFYVEPPGLAEEEIRNHGNITS